MNERIIKGKTHKKIRFLVVGPLRGGGGVKPPEPLRTTHFIFINGNNGRKKIKESMIRPLKKALIFCACLP